MCELNLPRTNVMSELIRKLEATISLLYLSKYAIVPD